MSFITGLIAGILIAAGFVAVEHYGSLIPPVGPFALSGNGALAATEILVPIAILLAIGYLIGLALLFFSPYPMVTMGTVAGTAAGHAWTSPGAKTFIAILVIILMAIAVFGVPYVLSGAPLLPR